VTPELIDIDQATGPRRDSRSRRQTTPVLVCRATFPAAELAGPLRIVVYCGSARKPDGKAVAADDPTRGMVAVRMSGAAMNRQDRADAVDREMAARLLPDTGLQALGRWWSKNAERLADGTPGAHAVRYTPSRWAHITPCRRTGLSPQPDTSERPRLLAAAWPGPAGVDCHFAELGILTRRRTVVSPRAAEGPLRARDRGRRIEKALRH
jgi:hypothetical protein